MGRANISSPTTRSTQVASAPRADIQTEWGDLFFERHQAADALESYRKALELDGLWVAAHVGASRALSELPDADPALATAALERARKLAPEHPDVLRLTAERAIETEDFAAAGQALDRLAKARPGTVEEAALRVTLAYKSGGVAAVDSAAARVQEIDPRSALGYRAAGDQAAAPTTASTKPRPSRARRPRSTPTTRRPTSISGCT